MDYMGSHNLGSTVALTTKAIIGVGFKDFIGNLQQK